MENYSKRISDLEKELFRLKNKQQVFRLRLERIKVGDTIYLHGGYNEYFPQRVDGIDLEECIVHTYEKSTNKHSKLTSFSILENGKFIDIY